MNATFAAMFPPVERWIEKVGASTRKSRRMAGIRTTDHKEIIAALKTMRVVESPLKGGMPASVIRQRRQATEQWLRNVNRRAKGSLAD